MLPMLLVLIGLKGARDQDSTQDVVSKDGNLFYWLYTSLRSVSDSYIILSSINTNGGLSCNYFPYSYMSKNIQPFRLFSGALVTSSFFNQLDTSATLMNAAVGTSFMVLIAGERRFIWDDWTTKQNKRQYLTDSYTIRNIGQVNLSVEYIVET